MDVAHDDLISTLVVGLRLPHAEGDRIGLRVRKELESATFDDLGDALVELEGRCRRTLHSHREVRRRVCIKRTFYAILDEIQQLTYLNRHRTFDGGIRFLDIDDLRWSRWSDISKRCARLIDLILEVRHAGSSNVRARTTTLYQSITDIFNRFV